MLTLFSVSFLVIRCKTSDQLIDQISVCNTNLGRIDTYQDTDDSSPK